MPQAATATECGAMRILVTGITGFAGGALAEALLARPNVQVFGLSRGGAWPALRSHLAKHVALEKADLNDPQSIETMLRPIRPEQLYHLAGYAQVETPSQEPNSACPGN